MKLLAPLFLLPLLAPSIQAGGLVASQVDARAHWVAHLDLEAFHKSQLFQAAIEADEEKEIERGLAELLETEGLDLFRDVRAATIYGSGLDDESAVALIATDASAEPLLARWQEKLGAKPVDIAGHACVAWADGEDAGYSFLRAERESSARLLVISKSKESLGRALDVLEKKRASLATEPSEELSTTLSPGSFAFLAATGISNQLKDLAGAGPESAIARLAQGLRVELGERDGRIFFDARLRASRDEDALKVHQILQGLLALASFAGDEPEVGSTLTRWLKALELTRLTDTVRLHFEYDLKLLIQEARALEDLEKEKKDEDSEKGHEKHHDKDKKK